MLHCKKIIFTYITVLLLLVPGCGERLPPGMPKLYKTIITITQDGLPLAEAQVIAVSEDFANAPWTSGGITDAAGAVELKTEGRYSGIPAGRYSVTVTKTEGPPGIELPQKQSTDEEIREYERIRKQIEDNSVYVVEVKFMKPDTTPLKLEVQGKTQQTFDVSPAVKVKVPPSSSG